jgi:hypothetical protein
MRDIETIGSEPAIGGGDSRCGSEAGSVPRPSLDVVDALLDERRELDRKLTRR